MLIYDLLKMDHRMVLGIIDTIEMVNEPERRKDMFSLMRTELVMHSKSEEDHFYDPLYERIENKQFIETSRDEHQEIEQLLMKLQFSSAGNDKWLGNLRSLKALLKRHIQEETDIEATDIGVRFLEGKGRLGMENPFAVAAELVPVDNLPKDHKYFEYQKTVNSGGYIATEQVIRQHSDKFGKNYHFESEGPLESLSAYDEIVQKYAGIDRIAVI